MKINYELVEQINIMRAAGLTLKEIGAKFNISTPTVRKATSPECIEYVTRKYENSKKNNNIIKNEEENTTMKTKTILTTEQKKQMVKLVKEDGYKVPAVAKAFNVCQATVYNTLNMKYTKRADKEDKVMSLMCKVAGTDGSGALGIMLKKLPSQCRTEIYHATGKGVRKWREENGRDGAITLPVVRNPYPAAMVVSLLTNEKSAVECQQKYRINGDYVLVLRKQWENQDRRMLKRLGFYADETANRFPALQMVAYEIDKGRTVRAEYLSKLLLEHTSNAQARLELARRLSELRAMEDDE